MKRFLHRCYVRNFSGDTIVEVLVAAAVISLVLAGAYATANRSTLGVIDAREHEQALGIAQAQVEFLRSNTVLLASGDCFDPQGNEMGGNTAACAYDVKGLSGCNAASTWCYQAAITPVSSISGAPVSVNDPTYKVAVTWPSPQQGTSEVDLFYRVYQPTFAQGGGGGGGGGNGPLGDPSFHSNPCSGPCRPNPNPRYHFTIALQNNTTLIPDTEISGCSWNFGDGSPPVLNQACHNTDVIRHTFPGIAPDPYPIDCPGNGGTRQTYPVSLTVDLIGGGSAQVTHSYGIPECW